MLILHADSRCDVCLCEFVADMSSKSPHAIACGHIFCRDCLYSNTPPVCPMCRKAYQPNKMKKLHVDRPEEVDDRKEVDLLQRLVLSWDTPHEQLQQVVDEVDAWLATRHEDSCISLRKARTTLERHKALKVSESELRNIIPFYEEEKHQLELENYQTKEQAAMQIQIHEETHRTQLRELTKELAHWKLRSKNEPRPSPAPGYGSYGATRNPLPPPPEPIPVDQVPTFEQAVSQSGAMMRYSELPAESPGYLYEGESRSRGRRHRPSEERYSSYTSHTPASASSNHYVLPHVSPAHEYRSPSYMSAVDPHQPLQVQFHPGRPLDVFGLTSELIHEYGVGFAQGQRSAMRNRHDTVIIPPPYADPSPSRATVQPTSAYVEEAPAEHTNFYAAPPQSAPPVSSSSQRRHRRRSTLQSSIVSSSPSHDHGEERQLESRSRSESRGPTPSASSSSRSTRSQHVEVVNPHVATAHEVAAPHNNHAIDRRASPPVSMRSQSSWGTVHTNRTEGSLGIGLMAWRDMDHIRATSDASSARTRNSSISDMSSLGLGMNDGAARDASPARHIGGMTGVLPEEDPDLSSSSLSEAETVRQQSRDERGRHRSTTALEQREYHADSYRSEHSSTARLPEHDPRQHAYTREDRASSSSYRSSTAVDPRQYRSDYHEAPPPTMPHRDSEHSSYGHRRRSGQPLRTSDTLPVESPGFPVSVEYTTEEDADYYRRHDGRHSTLSAAEATSFTGNALGLELTSSGEISAPAPIVPTNSMLRTWSDHNRN